jgi:hypothetical protein
MNTKKAFFVLVGICAIGFLAWFLTKEREEITPPQKEEESATTTEKEAFSVVEETISNEGDIWLVDISYPQLVGEGRAFEDINEGIENEVEAIQEGFFENLDEEIPSFVPAGAKSALYIEFEEVTESETTISVPLLVSDYTAGAAHPNNYMRTMTYDRRTGREVRLEGLFSSDDYLMQLSLISRESLLKGGNGQYEVENSEWLQQGTAPREENFQEFLINDSTLIIIFNPYQVAPYAAGILRARIPIDRFEGFRM